MRFLKKKEFLEGIVVHGVDGQKRVLSELWYDKVVVLKVLHGAGCPLCRYESRLLSDLKPYFDELNVRLVGVGFEGVGLQEFLDSKYWEWDLFLDPTRSVHSALGLEVPFVSRIASKLGLGMNRGKAMCRTFVISPTQGVIYEYRQKGATNPSIKGIFSIVGGDPALVAETTPEEYLFDPKLTPMAPTVFSAETINPTL